MKKWKERLTDSLVVDDIIPKLDRIPHDRARHFTFHIRNLEVPTSRFRIRRIVQCRFGLPTSRSRTRRRCGPLQPQNPNPNQQQKGTRTRLSLDSRINSEKKRKTERTKSEDPVSTCTDRFCLLLPTSMGTVYILERVDMGKRG